MLTNFFVGSAFKQRMNRPRRTRILPHCGVQMRTLARSVIIGVPKFSTQIRLQVDSRVLSDINLQSNTVDDDIDKHVDPRCIILRKSDFYEVIPAVYSNPTYRSTIRELPPRTVSALRRG